MALSGTLGSIGLDDVVGFLSTHGVEGVLTICGATASLRLLVLPGRLLIPERSGRLSADALDALLARAERVGRSRARHMSTAQVDELMARARDTRSRSTPVRYAPRSGSIKRAELEALHARAAQTKTERLAAGGRVSRNTLDGMLARADKLGEPDVAARRHRVAEQVHAVSASRGASFDFAPCAVPEDFVRDLEARGGLAIEPLALLMEVARLDDEHQRKPSQAPTRAVRRPESTPTTAAALQGDIDGVGLAALLQTLRERRRGGTLVLKAGGGALEERLYFVEGEAFALRVDADDEFAFTLLGADAADSVRALVRGAAVEERALTAADQQRLRERFLDVLFAEGATFAFLQDDLPPDVHAPRRGITRIALQTERFLLEAIQRMVEWDTLRESIADGRAVLRFASPTAKLTAIRERGLPEVLTLVDGRLSFDEVVVAARAPRVETARLVSALLAEKLLLAT